MKTFDQDKHKIIGFDMDGVILDHTDNKIRLAETFGWDIGPEQTHSEIIKQVMPPDTVRALQTLLYDDPEVSIESPLMPGAKTILMKLQGRFSYFLISRRRRPDVAVEILKFQGLWPGFFNEKNTFFVVHPEDKNIAAVQLGVTHYFDDEASVLDHLTDIDHRILFDPFDLFVNKGYQRVHSWTEIAKLLMNK